MRTERGLRPSMMPEEGKPKSGVTIHVVHGGEPIGMRVGMGSGY